MNGTEIVRDTCVLCGCSSGIGCLTCPCHKRMANFKSIDDKDAKRILSDLCKEYDELFKTLAGKITC